jgi:alginate O-acetyltransferase complex protein AlgI
MLFSIVLDQEAGARIHGSSNAQTQWRWLMVSLVGNLGVLGAFKYFGFFTESFNALLVAVGGGPALPVFEVVLPVGISFYTFQSMSYSIDIYRGDAKPADSAWQFAAYVSMFPQLVAGPIVRWSYLAEQLAALPERPQSDDIAVGIQRFTIGMAKKVLVADILGAWINPALANWQELGWVGAWTCLVGYAMQLYFDFSGYSDMAVGLGRMLGLRLPENFRAPYRAANVASLWRRWHITLMEFLRDDLYIPLGGSRGSAGRVYAVTVLTMVLAGLWHGAAWTYILWGLLHGLFLVVFRLWSKAGFQLPHWLAVLVTFGSGILGYALFRATSMEMSFGMYGRMLGLNGLGLSGDWLWPLVSTCAALLIVFRAPLAQDLPLFRNTTAALTLAGCLWVCVLRFSVHSPYLYFQF